MLDLALPVEITRSVPQDTWEVVVAVATAVATVGAVIAALLIASVDRRKADRRATDDREDFRGRQRAEHEHDRRVADATWRLDLLLRIADAHHVYRAAAPVTIEERQAKASVSALVEAYPDRLPILLHLHRDQSGYAEEWSISDEELREVTALYGYASSGLEPEMLAMPEIRYYIQSARQELLTERSDGLRAKAR